MKDQWLISPCVSAESTEWHSVVAIENKVLISTCHASTLFWKYLSTQLLVPSADSMWCLPSHGMPNRVLSKFFSANLKCFSFTTSHNFSLLTKQPNLGPRICKVIPPSAQICEPLSCGCIVSIPNLFSTMCSNGWNKE